jgi:hypothetical protein
MGRFTRRTFLKALGVGGATLFVPDAALALPERRYWALDGTRLAPWAIPQKRVYSDQDGQALALFRDGRDGREVLAQSQSLTFASHHLVAVVACRPGDVLRSSVARECFTVPLAGRYLISGESGPAGRRFVAQWLGRA